MVNNINQLLVQARSSYNANNWSSLIQCLQLIQESKDPEIVKNQEQLLEFALAILEMGDFHQRWEIAKVFVRFGSAAIPPLLEILEDEERDEESRSFAAQILGELKNPESIPPLVDLIKISEDEELPAAAAAALAQMGAVAIPALTELLTEEDTRLLAVRSLCCIRRTETIAPLLTVVEDPEVEIRAAAVEALSSFHDSRVPPILLRALDDTAATVRRCAVLGLGFRPDLRDELDLVTKLFAKLYDFNQDVCCAAAQALSRIGGDDAQQHLFEVLMSPHTPVKLQLEIIRALSWIETPSSLEYLQLALNQLQSVTLWQEIVTVLGRVQQKELTAQAASILLEMLELRHRAVEIAAIKSAIALSLGQLGRIEAIEPLIELLADPDPQVRLHIVAALKNLAPVTAYEKLQDLANNSGSPLQPGVAAALAQW
ncbi:MAG TPA: PBS lyase [Cyanobacteria bacterium UBA11049]|nr:PBS lyase [Cyanobacteria bacterium UBA11049]